MIRSNYFAGQNFRPGILSRLGVLIVAQVVFLFAAIALVLLYPENSRRVDTGDSEVSNLFRDIERQLAQISSERGSREDTLRVGDRLTRHVSQYGTLKSLVIMQVEPTRHELFNWDADHNTEPQGSLTTTQLATLASTLPIGSELHLIEHDLTPVHLKRFDVAQLGGVVVVVAEQSDIIASSRSHLVRTIAILFLFSTLVSLLIVYLLWKRLKEPLDTLAQRVEATAADTGSCTNREADQEEEIARLTQGFDRLADLCQRDHTAAREADVKLNEARCELRDSQQFLRTIIEKSPSGTIVTDADGKIAMINAAAARECSCEASSAVGRSVAEMFAVPGGSVSTCQSRSGFETVCWRPDGNSFPAYILTETIEDTPGHVKARLFIIRDIVESRGYQDMIVRLDRNATRGAMAADIGHEINNFLAVLLGNLELLPRSIAKGDEPGIKKKLDLMKANVEKIARFADGLMVESAGEDVQLNSASINQIVENVIAFLRDQNRFDGVDWVVQLRPDMPMADLDDARVQQVLVNLLYNAAEAVGEIDGNHVISVITRPGERDGVAVVCVDVKDNGPGVQTDKESLLFKTRFTTKRKGHGFGLMTCQRIVDQHSGWIGYKYDQGARFWFEIPLVCQDKSVGTDSPAVAATV